MGTDGALDQIRRLLQHSAWADAEILAGLRACASPNSHALREYAHILGTEETWLARLEQRQRRVAIWPELDLDVAAALCSTLRADYERFVNELTATDLDRSVGYVNSAGQAFTNTVSDILLHVALHGQYHRGKVNLLLRQSGEEPAPTDFIAFVRGVPAATQSDAGSV